MNNDLLHILRLFSVMIYFFIASQGGFYLLCFARVLQTIPTDQFLRIRQVINSVIERPLKILYLLAPVCLVIWLILTLKFKDIPSSLPLVLALALLTADMVIAFKRSIPLNVLIEMLANETCREEAHQVQQRWLKYIVIRGYLSVGGFMWLVIQVLTDP